MSYISLHNHDKKGSLLDSILTVEEMAKFADENGYPAIASTNHGYMYSYVDFYKACIKRNIKPILGCEIYEVNNMEEKNDSKEYKQRRYHLVLLAKTKKGLQNLFKIVSKGCTDGFYFKPRVDLKYIKDNNLGKDIICLTACQIGRLSYGLNNKLDMKPYWDKLNSIFDYVAVELQSHGTDSQKQANLKILEFIKKYNVPFVITTDSHMMKKEQVDTHSIFVQIGEGREVGESYEGCYLQTEKDIHNYLDKYLGIETVNKGLQETLKINNMIELIDIGLKNKNQMPQINHPSEFKNNDDYFKYLIYKDFDNKFNYLSQKEKNRRKERLEMEFPILKAVDYIDYFIMLYMLVQEADKRGIPRGYSRGSGANCESLFMLGVTQIDSIKWDLDFSRFANLGRKSMADFDFDISKRRRKEMVNISCDLFGKDKVAPICTFNSLSTKVAIRDIGKVLDEKKIYEIPYKLRDEVAKMIPTIKTLNDLGEEENKEILLKEILFKNDKLKQYYEKYPLWFKYVMELEGSPKSVGRHAAGTIIAPKPLLEYCPLCLDSEGNTMIQLEMHNAMDDLKLIKMDFLGLETLDIIDDTLKIANKTWQEVDINHLDLNDKNVYDNIYKEGNTIGIFQMESAEATQMCIDAKTNNIEDIIAINAFNRPGTKDGFPEYIKNKLYPDEVKVLHEDLKKIFEKTHYVLLYQEQALQMFRHAEFPEEQVDNARRAIGHKEKETMNKLYGDFTKGLKHKNWNDSQIDEIWQLMSKQAEYCFNKGHSTAYGLLSYLTAYLKYYYPLEFMTACLISKTGNVSKLSIFINECHRLGIKVLPPNINYSKSNFTPRIDKNEILFGILPIKGIGETVVDTIIKNQPYKNYKDFIEKTRESKTITKDIIIALIKAGAFPIKNKKTFLQNYADSLFIKKEYSPVVSLPSLKILKEEWNIEEKNKELRLKLYNKKKEQIFYKEQNEKLRIHRENFAQKYLQDEYMWEFETLSMFLTNNPFEKAYKYVKSFEDVSDGSKAVVICTIIDIKRKKDKNNNPFAYLDLYTPFGIIESVCWASKYTKYQSLITKGNSLSILGRKNEDKLFVEDIKTFEQWKKDINID